MQAMTGGGCGAVQSTMKAVAKKCRYVMCHQCFASKQQSRKHGTNSTSRPSSIALAKQRLSTMSPLWTTQSWRERCCQPATREQRVNQVAVWSDIIIILVPPRLKRIAVFEPTLQILMNGIDFCGSYLLQQAASQSHGKLSVD
jgi:hypothetical protein